MSKKTIAFTMPAAGRRPRKSAPVVLDGLTGETVPFAAADEQNLYDVGHDPKSDQWVRDDALDAGPSRIPEPPSGAFGGRREHDDRSFRRAESDGSDGVECHASVCAWVVLVGPRDRKTPAPLGRLDQNVSAMRPPISLWTAFRASIGAEDPV